MTVISGPGTGSPETGSPVTGSPVTGSPETGGAGTASTGLSAEAASEVVTEFFHRYGAHDVEGMTELCAVNAGFSYVPFEIWGKQRVLRGDGKVGTVGKAIWTGFINSFPDFSNTVHTVSANDAGDVVVEADLGGTQRLPWGLTAPAGRHFSEPHLFVFHVGADRLIDSITAYWDNAGISRQLGHNEVD
ncbi:MAG TPA: nuclear transport factor 2 family protein [Trebonia sp.]|nr:nuclear transport factor 2 family protein [Trebonia sp.]